MTITMVIQIARGWGGIAFFLVSKGNPRLDTLELIAKGLTSELMLIPKEKLGAVMALLEQESSEPGKAHVSQAKKTAKKDAKKSLSDDPGQGLLGDESCRNSMESN
jgi:hypothetical protein